MMGPVPFRREDAMSLLTGSFSLSRYRLDQEPLDGVFSQVRDLVARFAFVDIEDSDAETSVGWVDAADPYDPGFNRLGINVGPFIVLGLRQDARTVSPALLKKYTELEARRLQAERPERPLTTLHRREVRDRTLARLRGRLPAATKVVHVVWDTDKGDIFLGAATAKWRQIFEELFLDTFDLMPILQAPPLAATRLDPEWSPDDLDRLTPANLAQVVGDG